MIDNLKKILNEDQDPKAIEKITAKLENLLMSNEEVGYIAVQKKTSGNYFSRQYCSNQQTYHFV